MSKALLIIAQDGYQDVEYGHTREELENAGVECIVASLSTEPAHGSLGGEVKPDISIKDAKAEDYDVIVIVGGPGALELANHSETMDLLQKADSNNQNIAAICISPAILAKAGVLEGKEATVWKSDESVAMLEQGKAVFVDKPVVVQEKRIPANGAPAAREFGKKIVEMLK